jgi:hypothetical protein
LLFGEVNQRINSDTIGSTEIELESWFENDVNTFHSVVSLNEEIFGDFWNVLIQTELLVGVQRT